MHNILFVGTDVYLICWWSTYFLGLIYPGGGSIGENIINFSGLFGTTKALMNQETVHCFCPSFLFSNSNWAPFRLEHLKWNCSIHTEAPALAGRFLQHNTLVFPAPSFSFKLQAKTIDSSRHFNLLTWPITTFPCFFVSRSFCWIDLNVEDVTHSSRSKREHTWATIHCSAQAYRPST